MTLRKPAQLVVLWFALVVLTSGLQASAAPAPLRLIPTPGQVPSRVISLDPLATYTLSKMGKNAHLAGQSSGVEFLPGLDAIPLLGPPDAPEIQGILAAKPDIIIARPSHHAALAPALQQGIPVLWLDTASLADA